MTFYESINIVEELPDWTGSSFAENRKKIFTVIALTR
jgi:hypothetical protein